MKNLFLILILLFPCVVSAQKKAGNEVYGLRDLKTTSAFHRMGVGGLTIGIGAVLMGGGVIMLGESKQDSDKTISYVITGAGAATALIGGLIMLKAGKEATKNASARGLKFAGQSLVYRF